MEVLSVEYLGVSSTEATLRFKSGEEELEGTVLGVLSIHGSFDKLFHPFCATKAESLAQVLRVFSEGANNVEVLSGENLRVASTDLERSLERAVLGVPSADCFSIICYFLQPKGRVYVGK